MESKEKKVLVADDDLRLLKQFEFLLEETGYSVSAVSDGETAYDALKAEHFDIVVTDIQMGGVVTGVTIASRSPADYPKTKVIVMTGMVGLADSAIAQEGFPGSYATLFKPISEEKLLSTIATALSASAEGAPTSTA